MSVKYLVSIQLNMEYEVCEFWSYEAAKSYYDAVPSEYKAWLSVVLQENG